MPKKNTRRRKQNWKFMRFWEIRSTIVTTLVSLCLGRYPHIRPRRTWDRFILPGLFFCTGKTRVKQLPRCCLVKRDPVGTLCIPPQVCLLRRFSRIPFRARGDNQTAKGSSPRLGNPLLSHQRHASQVLKNTIARGLQQSKNR